MSNLSIPSLNLKTERITQVYLSRFLTFILIQILVFFSLNVWGQLNGYFTVGDSQANYLTIGQALNDLYVQGIDGNVTLALIQGTHEGFSVNEISGSSVQNHLTIESVLLDSTTVTITGTISFNQTGHVTVRHITVSSGSQRSVYFNRSRDVFLESCILNSNYNSGSDDAQVYIQHKGQGQGEWCTFYINKCAISGSSRCIYSRGNLGKNIISNSILTANSSIAVKAIYSGIYSLINNDITGGIEIQGTVGFNGSVLTNNLINGKVDVNSMDSILNNTIYSNQTIYITSKYFRGNYFYGPYFRSSIYTTYLGNKIFMDNYFQGKITLGHSGRVTMINNIFLSDIFLGFNQQLLFTQNVLHGNLYYGNTSMAFQDFIIQNNIIIGGYIQARGHYSVISHNNFIDEAYLYVEYTNIQVHDNNFCQGIEGNTYPGNINHNNYYPLIYCYYDTTSVHYDPMYDPDNPGIATNPLLQGKSWSSAPATDFFGNPRNTPAAIGANEIYTCSDQMNNSLLVPCGEEIYLNMCNLPDSGNFYWTPDTCISNPLTAYPMITACENMTWYLHNDIHGLIDSVMVEIYPFQVKIAGMPLFYCGWGNTLNATYHPAATYEWTPSHGLSDPFIRNPILTLEDTTSLIYTLACTIPGCGTSYDTILIDFDPLPTILLYYPEQHNDTVYFYCWSTCTDEYFWDFGDGNSSYEENPVHIYQTPGTYAVSVTATNSFGSRTVSYNFYFYWTGIEQIVDQDTFRIFPNPASETLFINGLPETETVIINLYSMNGTLRLSEYCNNGSVAINLKELPSGIYIVQINTASGIWSKKVLVLP